MFLIHLDFPENYLYLSSENGYIIQITYYYSKVTL